MLTVSEGTSLGISGLDLGLAGGDLPLAGLEDLAVDDALDLVGLHLGALAAPSAIAVPPRSVASSEESPPPIFPKGVLAVERMTVFDICAFRRADPSGRRFKFRGNASRAAPGAAATPLLYCRPRASRGHRYAAGGGRGRPPRGDAVRGRGASRGARRRAGRGGRQGRLPEDGPASIPSAPGGRWWSGSETATSSSPSAPGWRPRSPPSRPPRCRPRSLALAGAGPGRGRGGRRGPGRGRDPRLLPLRSLQDARPRTTTRTADGKRLESISLVGEAELGESVEAARVVAEAANRARELQDLPANVVTPSYLADRAEGAGGGARVALLRGARPRGDRRDGHGRAGGGLPGDRRGAAADRAPLLGRTPRARPWAWSARASPSTPGASRSSPPARCTR